MRNRLLLALLFMFICSPAYAVCDATLTVCESGCDYTVLNTAVTDLETNCSSPTEPLSIEISGIWTGVDSTAVGISGISTDATNTLTIFTSGDARNNGTLSGYIRTAGGNNTNIAISYVIIDGLSFNTSNGAHYRGTVYVSASSLVGLVFKNNVIKLNDNYSLSGAFASDYYSGTITAYNNIVYANTSGQGKGFNYNYNTNLYNNTIYGMAIGIKAGGGTNLAKNNICYGNTTDYSGTFSASSTHNLASDTSTPEYNTYYDSKTLTFANTAGGDFHLVSTDTDAIGFGTDLSGTFTDDIDGDTRSAWDIGADEYIASATSSVTSTISIKGNGSYPRFRNVNFRFK